MIKNVLVLGAGSAGLLAAISLKRKIPQFTIRVVRSPEIGVIGVGESTTPQLPRHLFEYLKINRKLFYSLANPTWKMGIHFLWGPRKSFEYGFEPVLDVQWSDLPRPNGYYCDDSFEAVSQSNACMEQGKAFVRTSNGGPEIPVWAGFHLYNPQFVLALEVIAKEWGLEIIDGKTTGVVRGPEGIAAVVLDDGRKMEADFFIDASGFRSELLGRALEEPFISYANSLFCDRAVVGSWERGDDFIYPYTVAETMDAGWCWRIDHEHAVNRGYVFCSRFISDDQAREEFMRKNPKAKISDHAIKFRCGRYRRGWVENVVALGNASGFVEPLEANSLMALCAQCQTLVDFLRHSAFTPTPTMRDLYNKVFSQSWDDVRDFLAIHYRLNTRINTPFWETCRAEVDIANSIELLKFYEENGPTGLCRHLLPNKINTHNQYGIDGFLVMLVGNKVPYRGRHIATDMERQIWKRHQCQYKAQAEKGVDVKEALAFIKHPQWRWQGDA